MQLSTGMLGFGFALGLPFGLFALFPNTLKAMPKSGGWMTTVKVVLGFLELALALKFLSNADLVAHWDLLKREVFIGIWALISSLLTLYLFGIFRFKDGTRTVDEAEARGSKKLLDENSQDYTKWELVDKVGNVFNRLVLFNSKQYHASMDYFGTNKENGRLFQVFFFSTER